MKKDFSPDPERPLMMMRLRFGHEKPEIWRSVFPQLVKNRGCCDEVWFSTGIDVPTLEEHRRRSENIAACAADLRSCGIIPSLQIQATLGHGDELTAANGGTPGKSWGSYVGVHGEQCQYINCPRQPGFLEYFKLLSRIYASWHPGSVWIDDDLRLRNHRPAPDPCGCYCPYCLGLFGEQEGKSYTREELVAAYQQDDELFKRWEKFQMESLSQVAGTIVKAVLEISPETRFGLQHCRDLMRINVIDALNRHSGKRVGSRPGGGAYSDRYPHNMLDKTSLISMQIKEQQGYETLSQICPEIESCPRTFGCKTSQGHRIESLLYLAAGCDSLSYFIMDPMLESPEWYSEELLAPLNAEAGAYREFIRHNAGSFPGGVGVAAHADSFPLINEIGLPLTGNAYGAFSPGCCCRILCPKAAELLPEKELEEVFSSGCILNGESAMALQQRGLNRLIGGIKVRELTVPSLEYFTSDPLNRDLSSDRHAPLSRHGFVFDVPAGAAVRVLGVYRDGQGQEQGTASLILEKDSGAGCAILGYDGLNTQYISSSRARQLNLIADHVSGGKVPVIPVKPVQLFLMPRITADHTLRSVTFLNPTIGDQKACTFLLRGVPENISEASFIIPSEKPVTVPLLRESGVCKVTIPPLRPWAVGWLKIGD